MAEAALALLPRTGGGYDCYHAQWGGSSERLARVFERAESDRDEPLVACTWHHGGVVQPPLADAVDYLRFEILYRLTPAGVAVFVPIWFGLPPVVEFSPTAGALHRVYSIADIRHLRKFVRRRKRTLVDELQAGDRRVVDAVIDLYDSLAGPDLYASSRLTRLRAGQFQY